MIKKIKYFIEYFKYLKNPIDCLLFKFKFKKNITIMFKNSEKTITTDNVFILNRVMHVRSILDTSLDELIIFFDGLNSSNKVISWANVNILNPMIETDIDEYPLLEYFYPGYYTKANINYENRTVIDIGSFIGDTALIFANQGADVYGFEPVTKNYEYSLKMREINPRLKNRLHFFNLGVSDKPGKIRISDMDSTSCFRESSDNYDIEVTTIDNILNENNIEPDILKMDCEGCEFNIILNLDLSNFNDIIFEHHAVLVEKDYTLLTDKLINEGFKIRNIPLNTISFEKSGLIHAYK